MASEADDENLPDATPRDALLGDLRDMADGEVEAAEFTLGLLSRTQARQFEMEMIDSPHLRAAHAVCADALARELAHVPEVDAPEFSSHLDGLLSPEADEDTPWPRRLGYAILCFVVLLAVFDPRLW